MISGYREKVFAIIGVKVYAAGLYVNPSILSKLDAWKGQSAAQIQDDMPLFKSFFEGNNDMLFNFESLISLCYLNISELPVDILFKCRTYGEIDADCPGERC